jgi:hypothetical protein
MIKYEISITIFKYPRCITSIYISVWKIAWQLLKKLKILLSKIGEDL